MNVFTISYFFTWYTNLLFNVLNDLMQRVTQIEEPHKQEKN